MKKDLGKPGLAWKDETVDGEFIVSQLRETGVSKGLVPPGWGG